MEEGTQGKPQAPPGSTLKLSQFIHDDHQHTSKNQSHVEIKGYLYYHPLAHTAAYLPPSNTLILLNFHDLSFETVQGGLADLPSRIVWRQSGHPPESWKDKYDAPHRQHFVHIPVGLP